MPNRTIRILMVLAAASVGAQAQWLNYRAPDTPRTRDGKPNLTAPARRAADGKPDLSGVWQVEPTPVAEMTRMFGDLSPFGALGDNPSAFNKYFVNILADFKPAEAPLRPEFVAVLRERLGADTPLSHCLPIGVPADDYIPGPLKIIQTPQLILVRNEYENTLRQIYLDGRKAPADPEPLWLGYSVGKWEAHPISTPGSAASQAISRRTSAISSSRKASAVGRPIMPVTFTAIAMAIEKTKTRC